MGETHLGQEEMGAIGTRSRDAIVSSVINARCLGQRSKFGCYWQLRELWLKRKIFFFCIDTKRDELGK